MAEESRIVVQVFEDWIWTAPNLQIAIGSYKSQNPEGQSWGEIHPLEDN